MKSKVENGEVINFKKEIDRVIGKNTVEGAFVVGFITNALNQQRENTVKEIIDEIVGISFESKKDFLEVAKHLQEFLTKLEGKE